MMTELHVAIMQRDDVSFQEADNLVNEMKELLKEEENPEDVLFEFGFEPDYVMDLLFD
jgi:hypothetical protein